MDENTESYKTVSDFAEAIFKDKNSKFIAHIYPIENENDVSEKLEYLKKKYHDARHHCYAYILGVDKSQYRVNDDGEPSGSAGLPIYNQLLSNDLTNVLVTVVRYFGGTKLGIPGLINAYKTATKTVIENSIIIEKYPTDMLIIEFDYIDINNIMSYLKLNNIDIIEKHFDNKCSIKVEIQKHKKNELKEYFNSSKYKLDWIC